MGKEGTQKPGKKPPPPPPRERIVQRVLTACPTAAREAVDRAVPKRWELHSDVVVIKLDDAALAAAGVTREDVGKAVLDGLRCRLVLADDGGVDGELRKPQGCVVVAHDPTAPEDPVVRALKATLTAAQGEKQDGPTDPPTPAPTATIALHVENQVKYTFDASRIMFSSGNTTERVSMGVVTKKGADVMVDMFAGIGYFTLPVARAGAMVYALEKNPVSAGFLKQNAVLNKVADRVRVVCGDNRVVGDEFKGLATRVSMGFFDGQKDAAPFIPRAVEFLRPHPSGCGVQGTVHYHYLATKADHEITPTRHFAEYCPHIPCLPPLAGDASIVVPAADVCMRFAALTGTPTTPQCIARVVAIRKVKSYRPLIYHYVADITFEPYFA